MPEKNIRNNNEKLEENTIRRRYKEISYKYESLATNLEKDLRLLLNEENISYLTVYPRVKDIDSFIIKIREKNYKDPFEQCEDICGLRIIYYYLSDIKKISKIINKEFVVLDSQDKIEQMDSDRFGYRSFHFIVKIKEDWANAPNYRGLKDLKAEIQVRTVLMHAWAEIEHELAYKSDKDVPDKLRRKLSIISAQLEGSDEQFDKVRQTANAYRVELIEKARKKKIFDRKLRMNFDNLQAFLDFNFPKREKTKINTVGLLTELTSFHITMKGLVELYEEYKDILPSIEKDLGNAFSDKKYKCTQVGCVRVLLGVGNHNYYRLVYEGHLNPWSKVLKKWKQII